MILVGLTGGIASGKSTVAGLLRRKGAQVIDADRIGQESYLPGGPAYDPIVERFGSGVLDAEGAVDRGRLADIVFNDPKALEDLNAITHPVIADEIARLMEEARGDDGLVVLDAALLIEIFGGGKRPLGFDAVVVVAADFHDQVERMVHQREMEEADAKARISSQAAAESKLAVADYVIDNRGSLEDLEASVDSLWELLTSRGA
jgi:dephospho-CoA kinase